jgi:hypothetical protein
VHETRDFASKEEASGVARRWVRERKRERERRQRQKEEEEDGLAYGELPGEL